MMLLLFYLRAGFARYTASEVFQLGGLLRPSDLGTPDEGDQDYQTRSSCSWWADLKRRIHSGVGFDSFFRGFRIRYG